MITEHSRTYLTGIFRDHGIGGCRRGRDKAGDQLGDRSGGMSQARGCRAHLGVGALAWLSLACREREAWWAGHSWAVHSMINPAGALAGPGISSWAHRHMRPRMFRDHGRAQGPRDGSRAPGRLKGPGHLWCRVGLPRVDTFSTRLPRALPSTVARYAGAAQRTRHSPEGLRQTSGGTPFSRWRRGSSGLRQVTNSPFAGP